MDRLPAALAEKVPERDLDAGKGIDERPIAPEQVCGVQDVARQRVDVAGVTSERERRDDGVERGLGGRDRGVPERLAPADEAVVGLHPDKQDFEIGPRSACECRVRAAHVERQRDYRGLDRGDDHRGGDHQSLTDSSSLLYTWRHSPLRPRQRMADGIETSANPSPDNTAPPAYR